MKMQPLKPNFINMRSAIDQAMLSPVDGPPKPALPLLVSGLALDLENSCARIAGPGSCMQTLWFSFFSMVQAIIWTLI